MPRWLTFFFGCRQDAKQKEQAVLDAMDALTHHASHTVEQLSEQKKGMRRLSLAQKQQGEAVERLTHQVTTLASFLERKLDQKQGIVLSYKEVIDLLDRLNKVRTAGQSSATIVSLVDVTASHFMQLAGLQAIACEGERYPSQDCEVLGSVEHDHWSRGVVCDIVQQGYRDDAGETLRAAKVVVCSGPGVAEEATNVAEKQNIE